MIEAKEQATDEPRIRPDRASPDVPVAMSADEFRSAGHALIDRIAAMLEGLPRRSVTAGEGPEAVREALGADAPLPDGGRPAGELLEHAADLLSGHSLFNGHPRFFGYITASPTPIGMLGDLLAAAINPNAGAWVLSPMASEIEAQTVRWIAELIGYPSTTGGLLVSGGNMANFVGFLAARARAGSRSDIRSRGVGGEGAPRFTVYVSAETHTWVQKAADLFGLGTDAVRWVPTDGSFRMDLDALRDVVARDRAEGFEPMLVVGTAGSVMTGAVDPLPSLAEYCDCEGLWFHIDGAYGGVAGVSGLAPAELREGIALADSVAVDPHKWLYAPLEAGCALVRDAEALRDAFAYHPPYYHFGAEAINYVDLGMQNSRGFRALKVWLALQQAGREGYRRMIDQDIELARRMERRVQADPELQAMAQGLSITAFRYVPAALRGRQDEAEVAEYLDDLNREIQARIERGGEAFLSNAVIGGRYALRACIVNFNTTDADVDALPTIVTRVGTEVHAALGGPA